jgi:Zn-dependent membrane protease YugP
LYYLFLVARPGFDGRRLRIIIVKSPARKAATNRPMYWLLVILVIAVFVPQWWVGRVLRRYGTDRADFPGTGGEMALHLIERAGLQGVTVETTDRGDHYDPAARAVRLSPEHHDGKSLAAIVIAAHEVGHAIQHQQGYRPLVWRQGLAQLAASAERAGALILLALPLVAVATRSPASGLVMLAVGIGSMGGAALVHLVTLPVEFDASFRRALPLLESGAYLAPDDQRAARTILAAAALTYVAASLASMLNIWRWIRLLRR